jgi:ABC-type Fe3+/spermidine/putrescine transport system ATPase subunit
MRFELVDLQRGFKWTSLYVTHDQSEAMVMSDRIILMRAGHIEQQGAPPDLYERPASRFVAEFVGRANLQEGVLTAVSGSEGLVRLADGMVLRGHLSGSVRGKNLNERVYACIRPENLVVVAPDTSGENVVAAEVRRVGYLGSTLHCELKTESMNLRLDVPPRLAVTEGETICVRVDPAYVVIVAGDGASAEEESASRKAAPATLRAL